MMNTNANDAGASYEYPSFPRQFVSYAWYKPLLVALLTFVFMLVFQIAVLAITAIWTGGFGFIYSIDSGYDSMDVFSGPGAFFELSSIAVLLGALALAALIVRDRPFSSYSSSRGGWNWGAFGKCLLVALATIGLANVIGVFAFPTENATGVIAFTAVGFVMCTVLTPLQCVAEEYIFRGFIMQTIGSWFKIPVIAIIVQALAFASQHPYNDIGVGTIFLNGLIMGIVAWQTRGLEASSACHIVNNLSGFYLVGLGLDVIATNVTMESLVFSIVGDLLFATIVIVWGKKRNWFSVKHDGTFAFNQKVLAKRARKQGTQLPAGIPVATPVSVQPTPRHTTPEEWNRIQE